MWFQLQADAHNTSNFCFAEAGTVEFTANGIPFGTHRLYAALLPPASSGEAALTDGEGISASEFEITASPFFVPSFEWQHVPEGQQIPGGLDVEMQLNNEDPSLAKIPDPWQMQLWVATAPKYPAGAFFRVNVGRLATVNEVEGAIHAWGSEPEPESALAPSELAASVTMFGQHLHPWTTALDVRLFENYQEHLKVEWVPRQDVR